MKLFSLKLILVLTLHTADVLPQEIGSIKPFFFDAPFETFDSAINFFKENTSFRHVLESGWSVGDHLGVVDFYDDKFYFDTHPLISGFDTGRVVFGYSERNGEHSHLNAIHLTVDFTVEDDCELAYNRIFDQIKRNSDTELVHWEIDSFDHFKRLDLYIFRNRWTAMPDTYNIRLWGVQEIPKTEDLQKPLKAR